MIITIAILFLSWGIPVRHAIFIYIYRIIKYLVIISYQPYYHYNLLVQLSNNGFSIVVKLLLLIIRTIIKTILINHG